MKDFQGVIVEESLIDTNILSEINIISNQNSNKWHIYKVKVSKEDIEKISKNIKSNKWYAHFWKDKEIIAVFKNKTFTFNYDKKETWNQAIEYGISIGIPKEQLDFPIG
ncbi:MAG: hypothetical protein AABW71_03995 [Nanoarchaeota archaeon]